jgi:hypothetical protein
MLKNQFPEIAETQPEVLARHCTEAGMSEKAVGLWGKAAQLSLERSALVEAAQQFIRALDLIAALPATPALRRGQNGDGRHRSTGGKRVATCGRVGKSCRR